MTQAIMIQNKFNIPDFARYAISPEGFLFVTGGYDHHEEQFLKESYVLDEYRSFFKPLENMNDQRADHSVLWFKNKVFVFGGMGYRDESSGGKPFVKSLTSSEFFCPINQKWTLLPNFSKARQAFSVT